LRILAIESSAKAASAAVTQDGKLISQYYQASGLTHSRTLLKMAEDLLNNLELKIDDIDVIAVAKGPGSFTGVRIGVAAAKGLAWGADKPVCGVSTLEAMAYHLIDRENVIICPAMDARRSQIYNAKFKSEDGKLLRLCEDRAISLSQLIEEAKNDTIPYFFVGDGANLCYNAFLEEHLSAFLPPEPLVLQSAWGVACAASFTEPEPAYDLAPNYLRLSQAERERLAKEKDKSTGGNING
jgi:tRNA threonylcarbamoyladenosine biosynthesis protein TsaB